MPIVQAAFGNCRAVQLVNAGGDQLDMRAGMRRFEEPRLFAECVLKISVVAQRDAERGDAASSCSLHGRL